VLKNKLLRECWAKNRPNIADFAQKFAHYRLLYPTEFAPLPAQQRSAKSPGFVVWRKVLITLEYLW
jgi:hypothetical protein